MIRVARAYLEREMPVLFLTARTDEADRVLGLELGADARVAHVVGQAVDLTALEFDLLHAFAVAPGRVFGREELSERVWGASYGGDDRVVDVHVSNPICY